MTTVAVYETVPVTFPVDVNVVASTKRKLTTLYTYVCPLHPRELIKNSHFTHNAGQTVVLAPISFQQPECTFQIRTYDLRHVNDLRGVCSDRRAFEDLGARRHT